MSTLQFAINRICAPRQSFAAFAEMTQRLGLRAVEIRNDLPDAEISNGLPPADIGRIAAAHGLTILSINALYPFDKFDAARREEAAKLIRAAKESGAQGLVLCPLNSRSDDRNPAQRHADLVHALRELRPMLDNAGLIGFVEPLGFEECSLRRKSQAVKAFEEVEGSRKTFRLVHDTFHHHLAGEDRFFPEWTGLVHISGVDRAEGVPESASDLRDGHRGLVGPADRLGNVEQLRRLHAEGYKGFASFEPFAAEVAAAPDIEARLAASLQYLQRQLAA